VFSIYTCNSAPREECRVWQNNLRPHVALPPRLPCSPAWIFAVVYKYLPGARATLQRPIRQKRESKRGEQKVKTWARNEQFHFASAARVSRFDAI